MKYARAGRKIHTLAGLGSIGLIFFLWVLILFIQTITASNKEVERLAMELHTTSSELFERAMGTSSDPDYLETLLRRVRTNVALQNLTKTFPDDKLHVTVTGLTASDPIGEVNRKINYITDQIHVYKAAQYTSMAQLFFLFVLLVILSILVSALSYIEYRKKLMETEKQTELNIKLNDILEDERNMISLELHDDLAQKLSIIKQHFYEPDSLSEHSDLLRRYIGESIETVRQLANRLKSPGVDSRSLSKQLQILFSDFAGSSAIKLTPQTVGLTSLDIPETSALHLYRIIQELLTNCKKHSGATEVAIRILYSHPKITISYSDNGVGYDPLHVRDGLGLDGIHFRLKLLGGIVKDTSGSGMGTNIMIEVPV